MLDTLDSLKQYSQDVRVLGQKPGSDSSERHARILEMLPLVMHIAKRYLGKSTLSFLDLVGEGNLGLVEAAERYTQDKGAFRHYCSVYIEGYMLNAITKASTLLSMSKYKMDIIRRIQKLQREGNTLAQAAERLEVPMESVLELNSVQLDVMSLNAPTHQDEEESSLMQTLEADQAHSDPEAIALSQFTYASLGHLLCLLSSDERKVIVVQFGLNGEEECPSIAEIATRLHRDREYVQRLEERAMLKLKKYAQNFHLQENVA